MSLRIVRKKTVRSILIIGQRFATDIKRRKTPAGLINDDGSNLCVFRYCKDEFPRTINDQIVVHGQGLLAWNVD